jgi:aspartate-semialdehyde dehydrogenase
MRTPSLLLKPPPVPGTRRPGRIPAVVLGATGAVGRRLVALLAHHPWFELAGVAASEGSRGKTLGEALGPLDPWGRPWPSAVRGLTLESASPRRLQAPLAFSALGPEVAAGVEEDFARAGTLVVTNASPHRMLPGVPLLVPEVNPDALALLEEQGFPPGGGIVANPNCTTQGVALALAPLHAAFGVRAIHATSLQALSGAGDGGIPASLAADNVIPWIEGEEEKLAAELPKILGGAVGVSAQCTRVPVTDGHLVTLSVSLERRVSAEAARGVLRGFRGVPQALALPSAPRFPLHLVPGETGPLPRIHRDVEGGMAVSVGRIRPCPLLDLRLVLLVHNTVRGAAGGALLAAELLHARGWWRKADAPARAMGVGAASPRCEPAAEGLPRGPSRGGRDPAR